MNKLSFTVKFVTVPAREKNGLHPIYCRININRKKAEFALRELVDPKKWNEASQTIKGSPELTAKLNSIYNRLNDIRNDILKEGRVPTANEVKNLYLNISDKSTKLLDYLEQFIDQIDALPEYSTSTWKKYKTIKEHLIKFLKTNNKTQVTLHAIKPELIREFEYFLKTESKLSINTTTKYLKLLKTVFNRAIEFGKLDSNPMQNLKFKHERTNRTFLSNDELKRIEKFNAPNDSLNRVKNIFLFSCYTGLRFTDVGLLTPKSIVTDAKNNKWIEIREIQKTGDFLRIPLLHKAEQILDIYQDEAEITGKLLPLRSNQKVNAYLKIIADMCDIDKTLTFHMARHTFATTITLANNIPIEVVSKMLGHKDISTTQIYAKVLNESMTEFANILNQKL
jgi:site-specific recombinase XerD